MTDSSDISDRDRALFRSSVGNVEPVRHDRFVNKQSSTGREGHQRVDRPRQDSAYIQHAATKTEAGKLLEAGDELHYKRPGVQQKVLKKLKRGQFRIEATADLHGKTAGMARQSLKEFLQDCYHKGNRCVLIIHGKGHGSTNRKSVIKNNLCSWLREFSNVLAFCSARPVDGGTGAVYVLLKTRPPVDE